MRSAIEFAKLFQSSWLMVAVALFFGCSRGQQPASDVGRQTMEDGRTAAEYLQAVFTRYRNAQSYRDEGVVRLTYRAENQTVREQAPLRVWMENASLYVEAYDVRIFTDSNGATTAWILDPSTRNFDSQVLALPSRNALRPDLNTLLSDAVLNQKLAAGLAGPPPQLDWLLSDQPMERLFAEDHEITFGEEIELDGRPCLTLQVNAEGDRYRFWIDKTASLIRRVDLPPISGPDDDSHPARLTLELGGATFDAPTSAPVIDDLPAQPRFVSRFVPQPPARPPEALGQTPHMFRLKDRSGQIEISNQGSDRDVTILLFATDDDSSVWNAVSLSQWVSTMSVDVQNRIRVAVVTDKVTANKLPTNLSLPVVIDPLRQVKRAVTHTNRDPNFELIIVDRNSRIAWLQQPTLGPDGFAPLGPIVRDILNGVDVAGRYLNQWRADVATYQNMLDAEIRAHQAATGQH